MHRTRIGRRLGAAVGVAGILAGATTLAATPATARNPYSATANASALRVSIYDPDIIPFLQGGGFDATSPSAQVAGDTLGGGRGVASLVYPGDDIAGLTQIVGQFAPPNVTVPELPKYPLTVVADSGTPKPEPQNSAGYQLSAEVGDGTAKAEANGGLPKIFPVGSITATSTVAPTDGDGVRATGTASISLVSLPGLLNLGTVTSTAVAERDGSGKLVRSSSMAITGASVLGLPLEIRDNKLVVPILGSALPIADAIQKLTVLAPLKQRGITLELTKPQEIPNGIIAPAVQLSFVTETPKLPLPAVDLPNLIPGQPAIGPIPPSTYTTVITLGYATASATLTPLPPFDAGGTPPVPITGGGTPAQGGGAVSSVDTPAPVDSGTPPTDQTPLDSGTDLGPGPTDQPAPQSGLPAAQVKKSPRLAYRLSSSVDGSDVYLAIVVAALVALGTGQLVRFQGVRTTWRS